jgi:hypothetical protein
MGKNLEIVQLELHAGSELKITNPIIPTSLGLQK